MVLVTTKLSVEVECSLSTLRTMVRGGILSLKQQKNSNFRRLKSKCDECHSTTTMTIDEDQFSVNITTCTKSSSSRVLSVNRITLLQCFISTSYHSVVQPFNSHHHGRRKKRSSSSSPRPTPPAARSDVVDAPHFRLDDNDIKTWTAVTKTTEVTTRMHHRYVPPVSWTKMKKRTTGVVTERTPL
jgi:hypothetical protein